MRAQLTKSRKRLRRAAALAAILFCCALLFSQMPVASPDKKSGEVFKNVQVLKDIPSDQLIPSMKFITSALGVRCEYCHVENAFDKDDKKPKQIARKMMQMMFAINANNFDGKQQVTCFSCHRGSPKPLAIPTISESAPKPLNAEAAAPPPNPPDLPKADEIVQKYVAALGGADAMAKLKTLVEHGSAELGGREFQIDLDIKTPNRLAMITHFPGADGRTVFDGKNGFTLLPGSPLRPMSSGDLDAARMDSDLHFALDLKTVFPELQVEKKVMIGDKETILVTGKRSGLPPVEMYFDTQTGLLARVVRYEASALGLNPTQIDYSDYREVAGEKLPFHWVSSSPLGHFAVQISSVEPNASIGDETFARPAAAQ